MSVAATMKSESRGPEAGRGVLVRLAGAGESRLEGFAYVPERARDGAPLLVAIHGISRDAHEQARAFESLAEACGWVLLAPEFGEKRHADYQRLGRTGRGPRADHALESLIEHCGERFSLTFGPRYLFGYSAGGQFVHRYVMAHPERVDAAVVGAPGWFTFPDPKRAYPYGLRVGHELPGVRMSPREFLRTPVLLLVGSRDSERDPSLRQTRRVDRLQGHDRLERAVRWSEAMNGLARRRELPEPVRLQVLKGAGHDFGESCAAGLLDAAEAFLCDPEVASPKEATRHANGTPAANTTPPVKENR